MSRGVPMGPFDEFGPDCGVGRSKLEPPKHVKFTSSMNGWDYRAAAIQFTTREKRNSAAPIQYAQHGRDLVG